MTGIGWYRREDYDRLKAMFVDGHKLPATYDSWSKNAQAMYDKLTSEGRVVVKVEIDPDRFPEWCRARGMEMDARARAAYGSESAADQERQLGSKPGGSLSTSAWGMQTADKETLKTRIRLVLFVAALVALHASAVIWGHQLILKNRLAEVSPTVGTIIGSLEMVFAAFLLAYAWRGYQRLNQR